LEHDNHEDDQCRPLNDPRDPLTAHEPVNRFDLQEIAPREDIFIFPYISRLDSY
jgi:hypothetical protein